MPTIARAVLIVVVAASPAGAQTATTTLTVTLGGLAKLSFSSNSLAFPDADPDRVPQVPSVPAALSITARARATQTAAVTLTVVAVDDLRSGVDTIAVDALTWTASGPGFVAGTMSRTVPQVVASWAGSGVHVGEQSYRFQNRWTYAAGAYSVSLLYTLTAP